MADEDSYSGTGEAEEQSQDALLHDMQQDLLILVTEFNVPESKLRNLLEVVKILYEESEKRREELENVSDEMKKLEVVCVAEKEKCKALQKKKTELEHVYYEERANLESEKRKLEISNVSLESKIKQLKNQISDMEHDAQIMAEKMEQNERTRKELLEQYKRKYEEQRSIRQSVMMESLSIYKRPGATLKPYQLQTSTATNDGPKDQNPHEDYAKGPTPHEVEDARSLTPHEDEDARSLTPQEDDTRGQDSLEASILASRPAWQSIQDNVVSSVAPGKKETTGPSLAEELGCFDLVRTSIMAHVDPTASLMHSSWHQNSSIQQTAAMSDHMEQYMDFVFAQDPDPEIVATEKVEAEMIRKENEAWKEEKVQLIKEKQIIREEKEALESQISQLTLQICHLEESKMKLMQELQEVKGQRDELLNREEPTDDHHITSKDLYDLLEKHHKMREELERTRESNRRLRGLLNKPSWFARLIETINKALETPKEEKFTPPKMQKSAASTQRPPQIHSKSASNSFGIPKLTSHNGWLVEEGSSLPVNQLPTWIEHIPLKNITIDRIDSVSMGRICLLAGDQTRKTKTAANMPRWCAEVWVAGSDGEVLFIEVIDILCKSRTERTHCKFLVQGEKHITCMKCIPGGVEQTTVQRKPSLSISSSSDRSDLFSSGEKTQQGSIGGDVSLMWIVTEDNRLRLYPSSGNRHQFVSSIQLTSRTFCLLHVGRNVLIGQSDNRIVVYSLSRDNVWNMSSPSKEIVLLRPDQSTSSHEVRCMSVVGHKVWVGCGPYIHLLDVEDLINEKSVYLGQKDKIPQDIVPVSNHVVVSMSKGSCLCLYDMDTVTLLRTFDVAPMTFIYGDTTEMTKPVDIKSITTDGENIFVATSHGTMVVILCKQLEYPQLGGSSAEPFLKMSSVPIHSHKGKIRSLLHIPLPLAPVAMGAEAQGCMPPYRSLIVSAGKGYIKHSEFASEMEGSFQQSEDFQIIVWGHKITQ